MAPLATHLLLPGPLRVVQSPPMDALSEFVSAAAATAPLARYEGKTTGGDEALPKSWRISRSEQEIGRGREAYLRAEAALGRLDCMQLGWLRAVLHGDAMAIASRQFGCVWLMNANRVIARSSSARRSSVTWATTQRHVLAGEETLEVRWDAETDAVTFSIRALSRPHHLLSWATYPYVCFQQRRFARDATAAMERAASAAPGARG